MNIELLSQPLEPTENPGLETTDPRFIDMSSMVQEANYIGAALQAQTMIEEGIYDIRVIGYFCYGAFVEDGFKALTSALQSLSRIMRENWQAVGPAVKREKHAQNSLRWFVNQLLKKLQAEEEKKGDDWNRWIEEVSSDDVQETMDAIERFRRSLGMVLEDAAGPILDALMKVNGWLRSFQQIVYREPVEEPAQEEAAPEQEREEGADTGEYSSTRRDSAHAEAGSPSQTGRPFMGEEAPCVEGSYHLRVLMKKMEAFDRLIADGKFPRAALVADDIMQTLAAFDPKLYFPKLFVRFSFLLAANMGELLAYEEHKNTMEWQAMQEYYKVDIDGFVEF